MLDYAEYTIDGNGYQGNGHHRNGYGNLKELVSMVNEEMDAGASEYKERLKVVSVEIASVNHRLERLYDALETGSLQLADTETVKTYVVDLHNLLEESTLVERKSFIRSFVKEVRVTGMEALMTYTIPMPPKQLSQETLVVPPIVHYGGRYWN